MTLSFVHGFLGLPEDWKQILSHLPVEGHEADFRDLWLDLGWLASTGLDDGADWFRLLGERLASSIAGRKKDTVLIGYSMGGRVSLAAAQNQALWPYLKGLVLVSTHPGLKSDKERAQRREHDLQWAEKFASMPWSSLLQEWQGQGVLQRYGERLDLLRPERDFSRENLAMALKHLSLGCQPDFSDEVARWPFPVLLVTGEQDSKFVALNSAWIDSTKGKTNMAHQVLLKAGHRVPWDQPVEFSRLLRDFLDSV